MQTYKLTSQKDELYIQTCEGRVINTSPILEWMRGREVYKIKEWAKNKNITIEKIYNEKGEIWNLTDL